MVLFIEYEVLTFEPVNEILLMDHSSKTSSTVFYMVPFVLQYLQK